MNWGSAPLLTSMPSSKVLPPWFPWLVDEFWRRREHKQLWQAFSKCPLKARPQKTCQFRMPAVRMWKLGIQSHVWALVPVDPIGIGTCWIPTLLLPPGQWVAACVVWPPCAQQLSVLLFREPRMKHGEGEQCVYFPPVAGPPLHIGWNHWFSRCDQADTPKSGVLLISSHCFNASKRPGTQRFCCDFSVRVCRKVYLSPKGKTIRRPSQAPVWDRAGFSFLISTVGNFEKHDLKNKITFSLT